MQTAKLTKFATMHIVQSGTMRNVLMGAGFAYAIEKETPWHLPLVLVFPSPYVGYHAFKERDAILRCL